MNNCAISKTNLLTSRSSNPRLLHRTKGNKGQKLEQPPEDPDLGRTIYLNQCLNYLDIGTYLLQRPPPKKNPPPALEQVFDNSLPKSDSWAMEILK